MADRKNITSYGSAEFGNFRKELDKIGDSEYVKKHTETVAPATTPAADSQQAKSDKTLRNQEKNTLTGDAEIYPTPGILPDQKVKLNGLGKNYSGLYYVESVTIDIDGTSGIAMSLSLSKNGIGDGTTKGTSATKKDTLPPKKKNKTSDAEETTRSDITPLS